MINYSSDSHLKRLENWTACPKAGAFRVDTGEQLTSFLKMSVLPNNKIVRRCYRSPRVGFRSTADRFGGLCVLRSIVRTPGLTKWAVGIVRKGDYLGHYYCWDNRAMFWVCGSEKDLTTVLHIYIYMSSYVMYFRCQW